MTDSERVRRYETPLARFMRSMSSEQKTVFAETCGTTKNYLTHLQDQEDPNPSLLLSTALVKESKRLSDLGVTTAAPLTFDDLLVGRVKFKLEEDHTTGEVFALLPTGKMARRRLDTLGRIVLLDDKGGIIGIEDSFPSKTAVRKIKPLEE